MTLKNPPETMLQYVVRKLNDKAFNNSEIARRANLGKATLSEIASGKNPDPQSSTVQRLYDAFKALAD